MSQQFLWRLSGVVVFLALACGGKPDAAPAGGATSSVAAAPATTTDPRGAIFVTKGCPQCHSISAFGIKSATEVGPDLTLAYEDVQTRFGTKLEEFLAAPTGTMQVVLSSMITLTPAERDSVIRILKRLREEREEQAERQDSHPR